MVNFVVTEGGGSVYAGTGVTDEDGRAAEYWTMGPEPGTNTLEVRAVTGDGEKHLYDVFTAEGVVPPPVWAGDHHTCGLDVWGKAYCWGDNDHGQLGDGTTTESLVPTLVRGVPRHYTSLTAGFDHTCGLDEEGLVYCWGENDEYQLGDLTQTDRLIPTAHYESSHYDALTTARHQTCGLRDMGWSLLCWGLMVGTYDGQSGDLAGDQILVAVAPEETGPFRTLATGEYHTCMLDMEGVAHCLGYNSQGELGDGTTDRRFPELEVSGGLAFVTLTTAWHHTCGIDGAGAAYCWGSNPSGQLGDGTTANRLVPTAVSGGHTFVSLAVGQDHTCGVDEVGAAYCWGSNSSGQIGDGTTTDRWVPTQAQGWPPV